MADALPMPDPPLTNGVVALRAWSERDIPFVVAACRDPLMERSDERRDALVYGLLAHELRGPDA